MTPADYRYKWVRQFLPYSLDRDEKTIAKHLDRGWEEVLYDEVDRLPYNLIGPLPFGSSGLVLYRMRPDAYWWLSLNMVLKSQLQIEFELAHLPGTVSIERHEETVDF